MVGAENFIIVVETEIAAVVGRVVRLFVFFSFLIPSFPHHSLFRKNIGWLTFQALSVSCDRKHHYGSFRCLCWYLKGMSLKHIYFQTCTFYVGHPRIYDAFTTSHNLHLKCVRIGQNPIHHVLRRAVFPLYRPSGRWGNADYAKPTALKASM